MIACDTILASPNLLVIKNDLLKYHRLQDNFLLVTSGCYSDVRVLVRHIRAAMELHRMQFNRDYSHHELTHKISMIMREDLTFESTLKLMVTYYNEKEGAQLKILDGGKDIQSVDCAGQGMMGTEVCSSYIQPIYRPNMTEDQAYLCIKESMKIVLSRIPINYPRIKLVLVGKSGIVEKPDIRDVDLATISQV
ncbi:hypothetical protein WDU94_006238 [Cyamophila willieti]